MNRTRLIVAPLVIALLAMLTLRPAAADPRPEPGVDAMVVKLWPGAAPGERGGIGAEHDKGGGDKLGGPVVRLGDVTEPTISVYAAPADNATGAAVIVCPGGGYNILAWNLEGTEVAAWLNSIGVTAVVLKYRVPRRKGQPAWEAPLQDAQRAMRLVRANTEAWKIDPQRVGILGFSAGGHLSAAASTRFDAPAYDAIDDTDKLSARPDFTVLVYPAYIAPAGRPTELAPEITVTAKAPPAFIVQTQDDKSYIDSALAYYIALKAHKVPVEMHLYPAGGHGYGLRYPAGGVGDWPAQAAAWMQRLGVREPAP